MCVFLSVCWICLHLSPYIRSRFSWIISETEMVSRIFYFKSLCALKLRHLSIDEEKSEPIACGWQTFYTFSQALINVIDILEQSMLL